MEHVVSRADPAGTETSPSASPEPNVLEKLMDLDQFDFVNTNIVDTGEARLPKDDEDDGLEFQLFAAPKAGGDLNASRSGEAHKIRLRSPSLDPENFGFVRPHRSQSYYLAAPLSGEERNELESAALTGNQVLKYSQRPWPGSAYAWKVLRLPPSGLSKDLQHLPPATLSRLTGDEQSKKRTRPGKKYRIKLRKKHAATQAKKDAKKADAEAKEAAEREKRTRRNREKKVKKKAKEKAAKTEGKGEGGEEGGERVEGGEDDE